MRKIIILSLFASACLAIPRTYAAVPATTVGRILLQTEQHGEAWYVDPITQTRTYVRNGTAAYAALRTFGLGITNSEINKIPVGIDTGWIATDTDGDKLPDSLEVGLNTSPTSIDTDSDGYNDFTEVQLSYNPNGPGALNIDQSLVTRLRGRILLQVESRGEAWYVNPVDGKRYYMNNGPAAYSLMRLKSLGITDNNLASIPLFTGTIDCGDSYDCLIGAVETRTTATATSTSTINLSLLTDSTLTTTSKIFLSSSGDKSSLDITTLAQSLNGTDTGTTGTIMHCTYTDLSAMSAVLTRWNTNSFSTNDLSFATCTTTEPN